MSISLNVILNNDATEISQSLYLAEGLPFDLTFKGRRYLQAGYIETDPAAVDLNAHQGSDGIVSYVSPDAGFDTSDIFAVAYHNGLWIAAGSLGKMATSPDGVTWTQRTSSFSTSRIRDIAFGAGLFVAVGDDGKLATSPDGITWTQRSAGYGSTIILTVAFGGGKFVIGGFSGKLATSPDGITWTL